MTWIMPPYVLYGVKYIDLVSLPIPADLLGDLMARALCGTYGRGTGFHQTMPAVALTKAWYGSQLALSC